MSQSLAEIDVALEAASPLEHAIARIWAEVLNTDQLPDPTSNFFELGGESISMTMVLFRVQEELGVELPPASLLAKPVLAAFCELASASRNSS